MSRIISYSLYGTKPKYLVGAVRNAETLPKFYPEWRARFYVGHSVPVDIRTTLSNLGAEVIVMSGREDTSAMFWRFLTFCDPSAEYVMIRDADSRLSLRERYAVDAWLKSGRDFHIMRDHPLHYCCILGGLWGARVEALRGVSHVFETATPEGRHGEDQEFLQRHVYPLARKNALIHDSFFFREISRKPFPTRREGFTFVGEIFDESDLPIQSDRDVLAQAEQSFSWRWRMRLSSAARDILGFKST